MNAWSPRSPCTPGCAVHGAPPVRASDAALRCLNFLLAAGGSLLAGDSLDRPDAVRNRARRLLDALGVRLEGDDSPLSLPGDGGPPVGTLIVADHVSWLDVPALLAREPASLVAKREVGHWPLVGRLARRAGTCFLERESPRALPGAVAAVRDRLLAGQSVIVFPQGTTWCTEAGGSYRRAMFQSAIDAGAPVRPVTVSYRQHGVPSTVAAFVGDDSFVGSLRRVARAGGLAVRVEAHEALRPGAGVDRRMLAAAARRASSGGAPGAAAHGAGVRLPRSTEVSGRHA
ncbi:1-acyl-sn-glycerol-3-phosphate acyltransferase [Streptomyces triticagri]|uniref:1-acyl-sn-glycerol-3-phosphate acyltransferase n=1 Tax=Streptomyces triticagri TaxID=2293568 RepID=A0A372M2Z2_9ACTN|nr:lysophospholipid acyltransferase family protein [Streptomyces triticagri]RFU84677.1 1-acyl-sn-glycerol-3-phosphate acyltransferase [Streptomyces triticagri]